MRKAGQYFEVDGSAEGDELEFEFDAGAPAEPEAECEVDSPKPSRSPPPNASDSQSEISDFVSQIMSNRYTGFFSAAADAVLTLEPKAASFVPAPFPVSASDDPVPLAKKPEPAERGSNPPSCMGSPQDDLLTGLGLYDESEDHRDAVVDNGADDDEVPHVKTASPFAPSKPIISPKANPARPDIFEEQQRELARLRAMQQQLNHPRVVSVNPPASSPVSEVALPERGNNIKDAARRQLLEAILRGADQGLAKDQLTADEVLAQEGLDDQEAPSVSSSC